jgi:hypothetical protein
MINQQEREAFIPYSREELIKMCIADEKLSETDQKLFAQFCEILAAYYHFKFHHISEKIKINYAPFNPDHESEYAAHYTPEQLAKMEAEVVNNFQQILEQANYFPIDQNTLEKALSQQSLIELKTKVNFQELDRIVCYARGNNYETVTIKYLWKTISRQVDIFSRVALLVKLKKDNKILKNSAVNSNTDSEKIYVYHYKNIPQWDIELLFPNVKISMTWKDKLLLGVPAIGAAVPLLLRIFPQLLLIVGVIVFIVFGPEYVQSLKLTAREADVKNILQLLVISLSLLVTLGGFAVKQYTTYKNKQIKFQKNVTETLFFKNLSANLGVFQSLIDMAEEEECKEIILVYYHLLTGDRPFTPEVLDATIETWMQDKFGTIIDFDIHGPLANLAKIVGKTTNSDLTKSTEKALLSYDQAGYCQVLPLTEAKQVIDYIWDEAFSYNP